MQWGNNMNNLKKDITIIYMFRNGIATCLITLLAFIYHITTYYQISISQAVSKILTQNIYTVLYFLLVWVLNYLLFECYKMIYDLCKERLSWQLQGILCSIIPMIIVLVMWFILPLLFNINGLLLGTFMIARTILRIIKNRL